MEEKTGFVLLPGAGLGAWIWREVAPMLRLPSLAINYPQRDHKKVEEHYTLEDYANQAIWQVNSWDYDRYIIVAHSIGGLIGMRVAQKFRKKIAGFIGISAIIPEHGGSFFSAMPFPQRLIMPWMFRFGGTRPPEKVIRDGYCNDLKPEVAGEVVKRFAAESPHLYSDVCDAPVPQGKKLYIQTSADRQLPAKQQLRMAQHLDAQRITTLRSGHLPMLSYPKELAEQLNKFAFPEN